MPWPHTDRGGGGRVGAVDQASSAFKVCEHQTLQSMTGPPLKIRLKEGAEPVAHPNPSPLAAGSAVWAREGLQAGGHLEGAGMNSDHVVLKNGGDSKE